MTIEMKRTLVLCGFFFFTLPGICGAWETGKPPLKPEYYFYSETDFWGNLWMGYSFCSLEEIRKSALVREVHVYGAAAALGEKDEGKAQHLGLGRRLVRRAEALAREAGFSKLAVISSVGTREYYRRLGFHDGRLYQLTLPGGALTSIALDYDPGAFVVGAPSYDTGNNLVHVGSVRGVFYAVQVPLP